jgi:acetyl esterase
VDEGTLDPWVADWLKDNPMFATPVEELTPDVLALARGPVGPPPTVDISSVTDSTVDGVPVRIYRDDEPHALIVYFHGGGFTLGSIGLMDNVARQLAKSCRAVVVSVEYRLAPENPYPAGLDDCELVTRWALAEAAGLGVSTSSVFIGGESAGGNLAAAVALRLRDAGGPIPAGQILIYPGLAGRTLHPSMQIFDGLVISLAACRSFWSAYSGGRDLDQDPYAVPLAAPDLSGLPPALVLLGGCDMLRDEGRAYAARLRDAGVPTDEVCYPGQPHGFVNFEFPAAAEAFAKIGSWTEGQLGVTEQSR